MVGLGSEKVAVVDFDGVPGTQLFKGTVQVWEVDHR